MQRHSTNTLTPKGLTRTCVWFGSACRVPGFLAFWLYVVWFVEAGAKALGVRPCARTFSLLYKFSLAPLFFTLSPPCSPISLLPLLPHFLHSLPRHFLDIFKPSQSLGVIGLGVRITKRPLLSSCEVKCLSFPFLSRVFLSVWVL